MAYLTLITEHCKQQAQKYGERDTVDKISAKLEIDQTIAHWDNFLPHPVIKKSLGKSYRLIADQYIQKNSDEDVIVVRFLDVVPRSSPEYEQFINSPKEYCDRLAPTEEEMLIIDFSVNDSSSAKELSSPSNIEYQYLYSIPQTVSESSEMVYESQDWVELISHPSQHKLLTRYYDLISKLIQDPISSKQTHETCKKSSATIIYRRFDSQRLFLIAAFPTPDDARIQDVRQNYQRFLQASTDEISDELLLRYSHRSYPALVLADEDLWRNIETSETGNLALSPEEAEILNSVRSSVGDEKAYPLFINGRPGSGKSTILQYLFAENLYFHLSQNVRNRTDHPPIYLTYGSKLLDAAKTAVRTIIRSNSELAIDGSVDLANSDSVSVFDRSFGEFHRFLYSTLPLETQQEMPYEKKIDFSSFHQLWLEKSKKDPDSNVRALTPELAWHVIRTYIKGMRDDLGNYLDVEAYAELPTKQHTVLLETFELVFDKVWEGWYRPYCEAIGFWDTQDLARQVLNNDSLELSRYPVVFCDEAQDFTKIELEIIFRLSLFSRRLIQPEMLRSVPFAFAGDPFQTLNPTGFDWDAVRAGFHEKIVQGLDRFATSRLNFNYRELSYNYRSTANVVRFCNLIQLIRGIVFGNKNLIPQKVYFEDQASPMPVYFDVNDPICRTKLEEQAEIVVILPCQEGEEENYIENDPFLRSISPDTDRIRNFLSPMSAKGLEFSRVVLYKFGDEYIDKYSDLLSPLYDQRHVHQGSEASLPFQYFVNRLYVAASRAMKRLIIVDSEAGIESLWNQKDLSQFEALLEKYPSNGNWSVSDLAYVTKGIETSWSEDRDDPLTLAVNFFEAGKADRDPYKLRLAANSYRLAEREDEASKCDALRLEIEGNYVDAGQIHIELGNKTQALRCFWIARSYEDVKKTAVSNTHRHRAADYMLSKRSAADSKSFISYVYSLIDGPSWDEILSDDHWKEILNAVVVASGKEIHSDTQWQETYSQLARINSSGLQIQWSRELAKIAFNAKRYEEAISIWDEVGKSGYEDDEQYTKAKSEISVYPDNLEWLVKANNYEAVIDLWHQHQDQQLQDRQLQQVFSSCIELNRHDDLLTLLKRYPSEERYSRAIEYFATHKKHKVLEQIAQAFAAFRARNGDWFKAIDLTVSSKSHKLPKKIQEKMHSVVIREAAISETLPNETIKTKNYVEEYLRIVLMENKWNNLVDIQVAGAAIERAGKIIDSLEFYESIWRSKDIDATKDEMRFARERWVKCKVRQSNYSAGSGRERDFQKQLDEARRRAKSWQIDIDSLPEFPRIVDGDADISVVADVQIEIDDQKQKEIHDLLGLGWTAKRISEVLKVDEGIVINFRDQVD